MAVRRSWQRIEFLSTPSGVEGDTFRSRPFTVFTKFLSTPSGVEGDIVPRVCSPL